jgi:hypothetical protein
MERHFVGVVWPEYRRERSSAKRINVEGVLIIPKYFAGKENCSIYSIN